MWESAYAMSKEWGIQLKNQYFGETCFPPLSFNFYSDPFALFIYALFGGD